jgi:hypothetical protein
MLDDCVGHATKSALAAVSSIDESPLTELDTVDPSLTRRYSAAVVVSVE